MSDDTKAWPMLKPALSLAGRLQCSEILKIDEATAALVLEHDGADYILTMTIAPRQRTRQ
jgi:hypothetical protein